MGMVIHPWIKMLSFHWCGCWQPCQPMCPPKQSFVNNQDLWSTGKRNSATCFTQTHLTVALSIYFSIPHSPPAVIVTILRCCKCTHQVEQNTSFYKEDLMTLWSGCCRTNWVNVFLHPSYFSFLFHRYWICFKEMHVKKLFQHYVLVLTFIHLSVCF